MDAVFTSLVALGMGLAIWVARVVVSLWRGDVDALDALGDDEDEFGRIRIQPVVLSYEQERHFDNGER